MGKLTCPIPLFERWHGSFSFFFFNFYIVYLVPHAPLPSGVLLLLCWILIVLTTARVPLVLLHLLCMPLMLRIPPLSQILTRVLFLFSFFSTLLSVSPISPSLINVVAGNNKCTEDCCDKNGYEATKGWDPVCTLIPYGNCVYPLLHTGDRSRNSSIPRSFQICARLEISTVYITPILCVLAIKKDNAKFYCNP